MKRAPVDLDRAVADALRENNELKAKLRAFGLAWEESPSDSKAAALQRAFSAMEQTIEEMEEYLNGVDRSDFAELASAILQMPPAALPGLAAMADRRELRRAAALIRLMGRE
jgi:hypothetical protein